jgi:hypothetical protein
MTHDEYVQLQRSRVASLAAGMNDGSLNYLEGIIAVVALFSEVEVPENDEDFEAFTTAYSEFDDLPIGEPRQYWSKEALERHEPEIQKRIEWARGFLQSHCTSLVTRFSA